MHHHHRVIIIIILINLTIVIIVIIVITGYRVLVLIPSTRGCSSIIRVIRRILGEFSKSTRMIQTRAEFFTSLIWSDLHHHLIRSSSSSDQILVDHYRRWGMQKPRSSTSIIMGKHHSCDPEAVVSQWQTGQRFEYRLNFSFCLQTGGAPETNLWRKHSSI